MYGIKHGGADSFKAWVSVQTNANVDVSISLGGTVISMQRSNANGVVTFEVKRKGTYTVAHSNVISGDVIVTESKKTYNINIVYVTPADNLSAFGYQTGIAGVYWGDEANFRTGSIVRYSTSTYPTAYNAGSEVFGTGSTKTSIAVNSNITRYGFTQGISSGQTIYWTRFNYVYVNGAYYYSAYDPRARAAYTYTSYAGKVIRTSGSSTWDVPTGVRSVTIFVCGGGGSGGTSSSHYATYSFTGGGAGGGGGYTQQKTVSVTPGMRAIYNVGDGGAAVSGDYVSGNRGGTSTATLNGVTASAGGGFGGSAGSIEESSYGGNGGSGGGAGGYYRSGNVVDYTPGAGGFDGGDGGKNGGGFGFGGTGQVTSTKFDSTTYATGGKGGYKNGDSGAPGSDGTGNGGQGSWGRNASGKGGSGVVIFMYS